jgi:outer membrane protein insertion porin family
MLRSGIIAAALAACLLVAAADSAAQTPGASAQSFSPFVVKDIRVEGLQRTEPGTVFSYLPVKVGETMNEEKAQQAVRALFATGFFQDVRLEVDNDVLVVVVQERPAIAQIDFSGMKEFEPDNIRKALRELGLAEGRIFDRSLLDAAEQEIKRQYLSKGFYAAQVRSP